MSSIRKKLLHHLPYTRQIKTGLVEGPSPPTSWFYQKALEHVYRKVTLYRPSSLFLGIYLHIYKHIYIVIIIKRGCGFERFQGRMDRRVWMEHRKELNDAILYKWEK